MFSVEITDQPLEVAARTEAFPREAQTTGAVVSFVGYVRGEGIKAMALEHYPGMTEISIRETISSATRRWPLHQSGSIAHRASSVQTVDR